MAEYDGQDNLLWNYVYVGGSRLSRFNGATKHYYHNDMLGSACGITGGSTWERDYYPFGSDRNATGSSNDYKFTSKEVDEESGLYYFGARYYDPVLGRWTQVDPLWAEYPVWSPYVYALDNP